MANPAEAIDSRGAQRRNFATNVMRRIGEVIPVSSGTPSFPGIARREIIGAGLFSAGVALIAPKIKRLTYVPQPTEVNGSSDWINIDSPFFDLSHGHTEWIKSAINNNLPIKNTAEDVIAEFNRRLESKEAWQLGELFSFSLNAAGQNLRGIDTVRNGRTNKSVETMRVALIGVTPPFLWWLEKDFYRELGIDFSKYKTLDELLWGENGYVNIIPDIAAKPDPARIDLERKKRAFSPLFGGQDDTVHIVNWAFLVATDLLSRHVGYKEHQMIPNAFNEMVKPLWWSKKHQAMAIGLITSVGYELKSTFFSGYNSQSSGLRDPDWEDDIRAGIFGTIIGMQLAELAIRGVSVEEISRRLEKLNDPRLGKFETFYIPDLLTPDFQ